MAGRSQEKAESAITKMKAETGKTDAHFLKLDLADIKSKEFMAKEGRLDLLFNSG